MAGQGHRTGTNGAMALPSFRKRLIAATAVSLSAGWTVPALAQSDSEAALRREVAELRAQQAATEARIARLEAVLDTRAQQGPAAAQANGGTGMPVQLASQAVEASPAAPVNPAGGSAPGSPPAVVPAKLTLNGDLRLRYESNFDVPGARNRDRGVLRARLRAAYALNSWLTLGGQIATGDDDDPNTTDITLGNFDDDLAVSLDQVFMRAAFGRLTLAGGKIPQPFARTELVWDGDVSPQGVSATYKLDLGRGASAKANALYFLVDEATAGKDSRMIGGQVQFETAASKPLKFELAAGYYDYRLSSVAGGDVGDFRTNRFAAGRYLSDFDLLDVIAAVQYNGLGEKWPVRLVADYVHNYGATTDQRDGFGADLLLGRGSKVGDWRFGYGYAEADVDAILTAFSHDNTNLASNYLQHTWLVDYVIVPSVTLNATYYRYRAKSPLFTPAFSATEWANRLRLNLLATF